MVRDVREFAPPFFFFLFFPIFSSSLSFIFSSNPSLFFFSFWAITSKETQSERGKGKSQHFVARLHRLDFPPSPFFFPLSPFPLFLLASFFLVFFFSLFRTSASENADRRGREERECPVRDSDLSFFFPPLSFFPPYPLPSSFFPSFLLFSYSVHREHGASFSPACLVSVIVVIVVPLVGRCFLPSSPFFFFFPLLAPTPSFSQEQFLPLGEESADGEWKSFSR